MGLSIVTRKESSYKCKNRICYGQTFFSKWNSLPPYIDMTRKVSTVAGKKYAYYLCSTNKETKRCSSHRIPEKDLEDAVLVMLKQHIQNILHLKRILEFIGTVPFQEINMKKLQDRLEKKKQETERCKELRMMLYSDMKEGIVSKEDYVELHAAYGKRLRNAEEEYPCDPERNG